MLMGSIPRLAAIKGRDINVNINGVRIQQVQKCKHLGLVVDQFMSWCDQVGNIKKKVLPGLYMLKEM